MYVLSAEATALCVAQKLCLPIQSNLQPRCLNAVHFLTQSFLSGSNISFYLGFQTPLTRKPLEDRRPLTKVSLAAPP